MKEKESAPMATKEILSGLPRPVTGSGTAISPLGAVDRAGRPEVYRVSSRTYRIEFYFKQARQQGLPIDQAITQTITQVYTGNVKPRKGVTEKDDILQHLASLRFPAG
jgi:hypothetical protein